MTATEPKPPFVVTLLPGDVPPTGTHVKISADAEARAALARLADVPSVERFDAAFEVTPWGRDGYSVSGRISADLTQSCVVTLEPVAGRVDETVSTRLVPPEALARWEEKKDEEGGIDLDIDAEVPDAIEGGVIDLGALAVEYFLVGIDPYPRKEGAVFDAEGAGVGEGSAELSPFAVLARRNKE